MSIKKGSMIFLPILWVLLTSSFIAYNNKKIVGVIQAENTGELLAYVRLSVGENKIGTLSNEEGKFILKIPSYLRNDTLRVSHLGFKPKMIPLQNIHSDSLLISLEEQSLTLEEIDILSLTPEDTVRKCWKTRKINYETRSTLIQGFYQEEMGDFFSGSQFLFAEGVLELYKTPYDKKIPDKVRVLKGRQKLTPRVYTYQGQEYKLPFITQGPHLGILLDVMKDKSSFLNRKNQKYYKYIFEKVQYHNDRLTYVFSFYPKESRDFNGLFYGKIFVTIQASLR